MPMDNDQLLAELKKFMEELFHRANSTLRFESLDWETRISIISAIQSRTNGLMADLQHRLVILQERVAKLEESL